MNTEHEPNEVFKFLLIEDDDDHVKIMTRMISRVGFPNQVSRVKDGVEATEYLKTAKELPDLILLDLKLPKKDGHQILEELKADITFKLIPIIILTTSDAESDKIRAYEHHANSYLVKPLDIEQFKKMIDDLSSYWGEWNRLPQDGRL